jgi:DnaJ-class molecular chaperone
VAVPVPTAVLGGEADVPTMTGRPVRLRIPPLTQNGQVFRLRGYGMPATGKTGEQGDLYARVEAQLPTRLSDDERQHFEALAKTLGAPTSHSAA